MFAKHPVSTTPFDNAWVTTGETKLLVSLRTLQLSSEPLEVAPVAP